MEAEGRGQRRRQRAEGKGRGRNAHFFSSLSHIIEKWDYNGEVIFLFFVLYLFCGFMMGRSVKNMNPSKSPFVEAIEDKVRKEDN